MANIVREGYGQLELNNVAFRRDGRVEAQCKLNTTDFSETTPAQNGMLLAVDKANGEIKFAKDGKLPIALNYSTEHMYDERKNGLKDFCLVPGEFLPRLGYLSVGETFTTNCVSGDVATAKFGGASATGYIALGTTEPTYGPVLLVVDNAATMPDGQAAIKFQVLKA